MKYAILSTIVFISTLLFSCEKEEVACLNEKEFCSSVENKNYDQSLALINQYLAGLNYKDGATPAHLDQLKNWLACKACVSQAEVICYFCMYSNPPQGNLSVTLKSTQMKLGVTGSVPIKATSFIE